VKPYYEHTKALLAHIESQDEHLSYILQNRANFYRITTPRDDTLVEFLDACAGMARRLEEESQSRKGKADFANRDEQEQCSTEEAEE